MEMKIKKTSDCALTNEELVEKVDEWVDKMCKEGVKHWTLNIPARPNSDPDLLISELATRFSALQAQNRELVELLEEVQHSIKECKTNSGTVILGDNLERKIQSTLKGDTPKNG